MKRAKNVIRAVDHPLRSQILDHLKDVGESNVTNIYVKLRRTQPIISQHLSILRDAKVVNTRRDGKKIFYSIDTVELQRVYDLMGQF